MRQEKLQRLQTISVWKLAQKTLSHIFIYGDFSSHENKQRLLLQMDKSVCVCTQNYFCDPGMLSHCRILEYAVIYDMEEKENDRVDTQRSSGRLSQKPVQQLTLETLDI